MNFGNQQTLTIHGTSSDYVVLNFANTLGGLHFAGAIDLTGGITADHVLFNIYGGNTIMLTGGDTLQTSANNASQTLTYLDPNGSINVNSVNIFGHLFGGDSADMQIVSGATVTVPEPQTYVLLALTLGGLLMVRPRAALKALFKVT